MGATSGVDDGWANSGQAAILVANTTQWSPQSKHLKLMWKCVIRNMIEANRNEHSHSSYLSGAGW